MSAPARCPLCSSGASTAFTVQRGYRWFRCRGCGFVYLWPRPTPAELERAYQSYLPATPEGIAVWKRLMEDVFREALRLLRPREAAPGRLLDVGCAYGFFVERAGAAGWAAAGIDPSTAAVEEARARGVCAAVASVEAADFPPDAFDAVTLFYVLEHLLDPGAALRKVFGWLRPGGVLLLRVPHTAPLVRGLDALGIPNELLDPPHHLGDFSPGVLAGALGAAGFTGVRTFPGASTRPGGAAAFAVTKAASGFARFLHGATGGRLLLPGVSKTTVAYKPDAE